MQWMALAYARPSASVFMFVVDMSVFWSIADAATDRKSGATQLHTDHRRQKSDAAASASPALFVFLNLSIRQPPAPIHNSKYELRVQAARRLIPPIQL